MSKNIVVVGGGTAGWLTAMLIRKHYGSVHITVVEDPNKLPIIAGESGNVGINSMFSQLDIDTETWIKEVKAVPKIGGTFTDWNGVGTEFVHSLINHYSMEWDKDFPDVNDLYFKGLIANNIPFSEAFVSGQLVKDQKIPYTEDYYHNIPEPMWHFASRENADFLKRTGMKRGIKLVEGEYLESVKNEQGNITSIKLDGDRILPTDWVFDCTGFARKILFEEYNPPVEDFTNYFPARAVLAWWEDKCVPQITTKVTAMKYGWSWNIALQHRTGNGYIYDPDLINKDQALLEVREKFGQHIEPIAGFQYTPCHTSKPWQGNVIAIGLSAGFLEPLEGNGVALIVDSIRALNDAWDPYELPAENNQAKYNEKVWTSVIGISDFLALHYRGHRRDSEFWLSHAYDGFRIPPTLSARLKNWQHFMNGQGRIDNGFSYQYSVESWATVQQGLGLLDTTEFKKEYGNLLPIVKRYHEKTLKRYELQTKRCWTVEEWFKKWGT